MENQSEIQIIQGNKNPAYLEEAARIFYQAFRLKVHKIELFPKDADQAVRIITNSLIPGQILLAIFDDKPVGVLGIEDDHGRFMEFDLAELTKEFGFVGGFYRFLWLKFIGLIEKRPRHTLRVEAIAVSENVRGKGIGTRLLESVITRARAEGYDAVALEVVDTNPRARRLYESMGFKLTKTSHFGPFTHQAGFSASNNLRKDLF
ncbi:MAG: GNAT family N-acetyltransferase [Leptolinea sp.]